jgi:hypothetical protein
MYYVTKLGPIQTYFICPTLPSCRRHICFYPGFKRRETVTRRLVKCNLYRPHIFHVLSVHFWYSELMIISWKLKISVTMSILLSLVIVCMFPMLLWLQLFSTGVPSFPHHQFVLRLHYYYQLQKLKRQKIRVAFDGMKYIGLWSFNRIQSAELNWNILVVTEWDTHTDIWADCIHNIQIYLYLFVLHLCKERLTSGATPVTILVS